MNRRMLVLMAVSSWTGSGCVTSHDADLLRADLLDLGGQLSDAPDAESMGGALEGYVAYALARSPELRASYERWRAATLRIAQAGAFPDPVVMYGYYARPAHTRVGPQEHRLSVRQDIPWPVRLTAAADAQSLAAVSVQRRFEARALGVAAEVASSWWRLWGLRRVVTIQREQLTLLDGLAEVLQAQVATDSATQADLGQVDLTRSRIADAIGGTEEQILAAEASLRSSLGMRRQSPLPTEGQGWIALPTESLATLREAVAAHPALEAFAWAAGAERARSRSLNAARFPSFSFGADWILTGEAVGPGTQDSGDDAVVVNVGLRVPLWQGAYAEASEAAEADALAAELDGQDAEASALATLTRELSAVRDSYRRVRLYRDTLLPQAQSVYESVVGAYTVGRGSVAATLLAERDLLELAVGLELAYAEHGAAWARLERVVGRPVVHGDAAAEPAEPAAEPAEALEP